jgi:hypothetical protein
VLRLLSANLPACRSSTIPAAAIGFPRHATASGIGRRMRAWYTDPPMAKGIGLTWGRFPSLEIQVSTVPFKLNQDRRHHIPRQQRKVINWALVYWRGPKGGRLAFLVWF